MAVVIGDHDGRAPPIQPTASGHVEVKKCPYEGPENETVNETTKALVHG
jgi:hypothetical protein